MKDLGFIFYHRNRITIILNKLPYTGLTWLWILGWRCITEKLLFIPTCHSPRLLVSVLLLREDHLLQPWQLHLEHFL